ncbi:MAG: hypothetical protein KGI54_18735, partial [Pseudomonadota bacterium]|nr:hypothetical protein [Pseudomonadota bacterium]
MSLETAEYIGNLVATNPTASDPKSQGDDHLRLIKSTIQNSFPGAAGAVVIAGTDGGVADAYTLTPTPALPSYTAKSIVVFTPNATNTTTTPTLNISALGAVTIKGVDGNALSAGDLVSGVTYEAVYNGTNFVLRSQVPIDSPAFKGVPTAPTATTGTNTTQLATTAFVQTTAFNSALPSQTGNSGLFVTTNGTNASWASPFPSQAGNSGKLLSTNGSSTSWAAVSQVGLDHGFLLSNDGTSPNTVLDIAAGSRPDSTFTVQITGTAFTKNTTGTWVAGTGNAGMGTGLTIAASTWYHVFAIINSGSYDVYFDTSTTAANAPPGTTAHRYIGSFLTDASAHIIVFNQVGQQFKWAPGLPFPDLYNGTATTQTNVTIHTPLGFVTFPILAGTYIPSSTSSTAALYDGGSASLLFYVSALVPGSTTYTRFWTSELTTNTSSQIGYSVSSGDKLDLYSLGY